MTNINYDLLRGESGGEPPDGIHQAYLARAALVETSKGDALVTEWQTVGDSPYYWTTWFSFEGRRMGFTQDFLDSVGIGRANLTDDDALEAALHAITGNRFQVRTQAGAAWINTYVEDSPQQQLVEPDVPIDAVEPTPEPVAAAAAADDDIPF